MSRPDPCAPLASTSSATDQPPRATEFQRANHRRPPLVRSALGHVPHFRIANHMLDREGLYRLLPGPVQNLICSVHGLSIQRTRFGAPFWRLLEEAEARSHSTNAEVAHFRDQRLHDYVQYCAINVPYYRTWFTANDIDPMEIRTLQDLCALPVVTKQDVQTRVRDFVSTAIPSRRRVWVHTSGTTGAGLRLPTTTRAVREQWATWWRYRRWHGLQSDTWCGYLGGRTVVPPSQDGPPFWRYNVPGKQLLLSGFHMSPNNIPSYIGELRRMRPPVATRIPLLDCAVGAPYR